MAVPSRTEVEAIIAERIAADPAFRDALLADPRAVLSEVVGFDIPETVQVVLHEESLTQIHLTLSDTDELSDSDLDLVTGGMTPEPMAANAILDAPGANPLPWL